MVYVLGIESTAHTFGIGIVNDKGETIANIKDTLKVKEGGFLPREAAEHHYNVAKDILTNVLKEANFNLKDIDLIAFSRSPGIGQTLEVGALMSRYLALKYKKPIIGVNHCIAHIEIGKLHTGLKDPLVIFVSGANTQIIAYKNKRYRIYGETMDIGLGNALDQFGRALGIAFPAGPVLDKLYFKHKDYIDLPYTVKGMDLAFSGLLTATKQKIGKVDKNDLIYSFMHNAFAMLLEVVERALSYSNKKEVLLVGGVAASKALNKMLTKMAKQRNIKYKSVPMEYAGDNGLMIAWQGYLHYFKGNTKHTIKDTKVDPYQRIDDVVIDYL